MTDVKLQKGHPAIFRVPKSKAYLRISATFAAISVITIKVSVRGVVHAPNVLRGGAQLLNGSTRYLTRQRLPMAYDKTFLGCLFCSSSVFHVVFIVVACAGRDAATTVTSGVCHLIRGWQAAAALRGWGETVLMVLRRVRMSPADSGRCDGSTDVARGVGEGDIRLHWSRRLHVIVQYPGARFSKNLRKNLG